MRAAAEAQPQVLGHRAHLRAVVEGHHHEAQEDHGRDRADPVEVHGRGAVLRPVGGLPQQLQRSEVGGDEGEAGDPGRQRPAREEVVEARLDVALGREADAEHHDEVDEQDRVVDPVCVQPHHQRTTLTRCAPPPARLASVYVSSLRGVRLHCAAAPAPPAEHELAVPRDERAPAAALGHGRVAELRVREVPPARAPAAADVDPGQQDVTGGLEPELLARVAQPGEGLHAAPGAAAARGVEHPPGEPFSIRRPAVVGGDERNRWQSLSSQPHCATRRRWR